MSPKIPYGHPLNSPYPVSPHYTEQEAQSGAAMAYLMDATPLQVAEMERDYHAGRVARFVEEHRDAVFRKLQIHYVEYWTARLAKERKALSAASAAVDALQIKGETSL